MLVWVPKNTTSSPKGSNELPDDIMGMASAKGYWMCYEKKDDIQKLVDFLNVKSSKEGPLRVAITQAFLEGKKELRKGIDESQIIKRKEPEPEPEIVAELSSTMVAEQASEETATTPGDEGQKPVVEGEAVEMTTSGDNDVSHENADGASGVVEPKEGGNDVKEEQLANPNSGDDVEKAGGSTVMVAGEENGHAEASSGQANEVAVEDKMDTTPDDGVKEKDPPVASEAQVVETTATTPASEMKEKLVPVALKISEELSQEFLPEVRPYDE